MRLSFMTYVISKPGQWNHSMLSSTIRFFHFTGGLCWLWQRSEATYFVHDSASFSLTLWMAPWRRHLFLLCTIMNWTLWVIIGPCRLFAYNLRKYWMSSIHHHLTSEHWREGCLIIMLAWIDWFIFIYVQEIRPQNGTHFSKVNRFTFLIKLLCLRHIGLTAW